MSRRLLWRLALAAALATAGLSQIASAAWIHAKAILAQRLIASAWEDARHGASRRPWPWADMHPIARMRVRSRGIDLYVFDSASPRALAFGPGHVSGTALPASWGNSVIVAHRDTHFAFLRTLAANDEIEIESRDGGHAIYRVREVAIVHKEDEVRLCLVTLLCQGHLLIEDVPGVGKTMLAKALARSLDCSFRRLQLVSGDGLNDFQIDFRLEPGRLLLPDRDLLLRELLFQGRSI